MALNTLVIITGCGPVTPRPWKEAYLNVNEESAYQRFLKAHPNARNISALNISFDDAFTINTYGELSSN